jgi:Mg-chelatase subunit ChlD
VCGHEAPPGAGQEAEEGEKNESEQQLTQQQQQEQQQQQGRDSKCDADQAAEDAAGSSSSGALAGVVASAAAAVIAAVQPGQALDYHPADLLSRQQRINFGLKCKQLLDMGRCGWIHSILLPAMQQQQQLQQQLVQQEEGGSGKADAADLGVRRVAYIDQSVTGENTLLLVGKHSSCS